MKFQWIGERCRQAYVRQEAGTIFSLPTGVVQIVGLGAKTFLGDVDVNGNTDDYVWVWDHALKPDGSGTIPKDPTILPMPIAAGGDPAEWEDETKWIIFHKGISIGISTSDKEFINANIPFGVFFHLIKGDLNAKGDIEGGR